MASADWTELSNSISGSVCKRGVTAAVAGPNGGGVYRYVFNMISTATGFAGLRCGIANFGPTALGTAISGAMIRATTASSGISAMLFAALSASDVNGSNGYMLGLSDAEPGHIELRKGLLSIGLPDEAPGGVNTVLRRSTSTIASNTWVHLRLEAITNSNGDVVLNCYQNNLDLHTVEVPTWEAIPGMTQYIDDFAGINSGSAPYTSGYCGFGVKASALGARAYFDHLAIARQT